MRLFTAILFTEEVKDGLCRARDAVCGMCSDARPTRRENLHLTLSFIGETERLRDAKDALGALRFSGFTLETAGVGRFRGPGGETLWAGVAPSPELAALQKAQAGELEKRGFELEKRAYSPHVTLARGALPSPEFDKGAAEDALGAEKMEVVRVSLMKSERVDGKLVYTEIYSKEAEPRA